MFGHTYTGKCTSDRILVRRLRERYARHTMEYTFEQRITWMRLTPSALGEDAGRSSLDLNQTERAPDRRLEFRRIPAPQPVRPARYDRKVLKTE